MSMNHPQLNVKAWPAYMENLARQLEAIGHTDAAPHFTRMDWGKAVADQFTKLRSPALMVENYEAEGVDNRSDNLMVRRWVAFTVAVRVPGERLDDHALRLDLELEAENIALQVLARMRADQVHMAHLGTSTKVFADVDTDGWQGEVASALFAGTWVAFRIQVPVLNTERRLTYDPGQWNDDAGTPLLFDVSGITCANLNHPTLGLTTTQRLQCILPGYDFSTAAVQQALSAQQVQDLEEWLCGSGSGDGGECPMASVTFEHPNAGSGELVEIEAGGTYEVPRIAITCSDNVVLHGWTSARGGRYKDGDPLQIPPGLVLWDEGGPDEAPTLPLPPNRLLFVDKDGDPGELDLDVPEWAGILDDYFRHEVGGDPVPRIEVQHADGSVYRTSDVLRLAGGLAVADLQLAGVTIFGSDGETQLTTRKDGQDYTMPFVRLNYVNAAGSQVELGTYGVTGIAGGALEIDKLIPRAKLQDTAGNPLGLFSLADLEAERLEAPDGSVELVNSGDTYSNLFNVRSGQSLQVELDDIRVTTPDGGTSSYPSLKDIDIRDYQSGIAYQFSYQLWTGESAALGTGSEGNLFGSGWFDYTPPAYPESFAKLSNFTTLEANNIHGNTNRFTDENGAQTYAAGLVVDHLTGLMWHRVPAGGATWATAMSNVEASTQGGYSDWHLPPEKVLETLVNYGQSSANTMNYAPISLASDLWSGTSRPDDTTRARTYAIGGGGIVANRLKTDTTPYIMVRKHLV